MTTQPQNTDWSDIYENIYAREAERMIRHARLEPTPETIAVLARDLGNLACDLGDDFEPLSTIECAAELRRRIGGYKNLKSYLDCLLIGARKAQS